MALEMLHKQPACLCHLGVNDATEVTNLRVCVTKGFFFACSHVSGSDSRFIISSSEGC